MILAIDIGNTNIEIGVLSTQLGDFNISAKARYYTKITITSDQLGLFIISFLQANRIKPSVIKKLIFSSVVPPLNNLVIKMFQDYFSTKNADIIEVDKQTKLGVINCYKNPGEVGGDRLVNAAAAWYFYHQNCLIVDMGTATTICVVTADGRYLGGTIIPGMLTSLQALTQKAAKLPAIKIQKKEQLLSEDTISAIESGIYFSNYYALKGMLDHLAQEVGFTEYITLGTGGIITLFKDSRLFNFIDPELTLKGLKVIHDLQDKK